MMHIIMVITTTVESEGVKMSKKIEEFDLDDLLDTLSENVEDDVKTFDDVVNLYESLNRKLYVGDIVQCVGSAIDTMIRFWNDYDEKHQIPIEEREPIKIYINSGGGSLTETFVMIDAINLSKTPVWTIATGCCYSGGFFTFLAGHRRIAYEHSSFLYHEGSAGNHGTAGQLRNFQAFYEVQLSQLKDHVLSTTNITDAEYESIKKDDVWYTAKQALEKNIADEISKELI